jgi:hypothetical protein
VSAILVYKFGLLRPVDNATMVHQQVRAAHDYRNDLTMIERGRRAAIRSVLESEPDVAAALTGARAARALLDAALAVVASARASARTRAAGAPATGDVKSVRAVLHAAEGTFRQALQAVRTRSHVVSETDRINERAGELGRSARAHCGVYWGTYLLIEADMQASRKMPLYDGVEPNDPRYQRWTGKGRLGVQIQKGMSASAVFGADTRIRIDPVNERAWPATSTLGWSERRRLQHTTLHLRVSSDGAAPIWAAWPMSMHRPFPEGARIKGAVVNLRRVAGREEWTVCITLDVTDTQRAQCCGEGAVAVDLGWRLLCQPQAHNETELRVGTWRGEDGAAGTMTLSHHWSGGELKARELRSIRDKAFEAARDALAVWLASPGDRPAWLAAKTRALGQWRSAHRLAAVAQWWAAHRFDGDAQAFAALETWRYHDHHLWQWETHQRETTLRDRREQYRIFAAGLARRYRTLVLEAFDLRKLARLPAPEQVDGEAQAPRSQRQLVAPSELRDALVKAFVARGGEVVEVSAVDSTRICHACGVVELWDQAAELRHTCSACGVEWDQDDNAGANLLTRYRERLGGDETPGPARKAEKTGKEGSKWARAKALRAERDTRTGAARKALAKCAE